MAAPALAKPISSIAAESANLNVLRATAVLIVVGYHLHEVLAAANRSARLDLDPVGRVGVLLFFVHTAFVLMQSLERSERRGESLIAGFYIRRAFRIYPLSVLCVLAVTLLRIPRPIAGPFEWAGWPTIFSNLALTQNFTGHPSVSLPLWSLPYEVQMYAALPFLYLAWRRGRLGWPVMLLLSVLGVRMFSSRATALVQFVPCFMGGVLAFALSREQKVPQIPSWAWMPILLSVSAIYSATAKVAHLSVWSNSLSGQLLAAATCILIGALLPCFKEMAQGSTSGAAAFIAKYSYGIYLTHLPIMWFAIIRLAAEPIFVRVGALIGLLCLLPLACFHLIEQPMINVGRRLARPSSNSRGPAIGLHTRIL